MDSGTRVPLFIDSKTSVGRAAMLLAITENREAESIVKQMLEKEGYQCAVTEVGGNSVEIHKKLVNAVIGAALNREVIQKETREIHAILHATMEAERGFMLDVPSAANVGVKIGIVKNSRWIAVALFGQSALHNMTSHDRAGLGVMHYSQQL